MEENADKKISKFSSGINILMRVDNLWKNCHNFKRNGQYYKWNEELDSVWLELARDLNEEEYYDLDSKGKVIKKEDYYTYVKGSPIFDSKCYNEIVDKKGLKSQFDVFEDMIKKLLPFLDKGSSGFEEPDEDSLKKRDEQYKVLMEKQLFLARLENKLGKGTSWEEEEEDF